MDSEEFERPVVMYGHEVDRPCGPLALERAAVDLREEWFEGQHSGAQCVVGCDAGVLLAGDSVTSCCDFRGQTGLNRADSAGE